MGLIQRFKVFAIGTTANAILFLFLSRALLPLLAKGEEIAGTGPATSAMNLLPVTIQLAIGALQLGLIVYFVAGIGEQRTADRRPMP